MTEITNQFGKSVYIGNTGQPQPVGSDKKKRGCFFYGCLTVIVLIVLGVVGLFVAVKVGINWAVRNYTVTEPLKLPEVQASQEEYIQVRDRVLSFLKAVDTGQGPNELTLSARDLNVLVAEDPEWSKAKGVIYFEFKGNQAGGKLSMPMDGFGFSGRYFTGEALFNIGMFNGVPMVAFDSLVVNGNPVPAEIMKELKTSNLLEKALSDPKYSGKLDRIKALGVKDGVVTIVRE